MEVVFFGELHCPTLMSESRKKSCIFSPEIMIIYAETAFGRISLFFFPPGVKLDSAVQWLTLSVPMRCFSAVPFVLGREMTCASEYQF